MDRKQNAAELKAKAAKYRAIARARPSFTFVHCQFAMPQPDEADRFRRQAEEARQQAEKAISPIDKDAWLKVAGEWLELAVSVVARR
jgi:hypothetical protein